LVEFGEGGGPLESAATIRAYSIGLAVTTIRPIVGVFFATSRLTGLTPRDFFGIAFWLGFTAHVVAAELWISRSAPDSGFRWLRRSRQYS
jgi:hypothetical protein